MDIVPLWQTDWLAPLAIVLCGLLTIDCAWSRDHATSSVTAVLPLPGQRCGTQSAGTASATGHHLQTVQTIVENVYVWLVGPRRPVSER